MTPAEAISRLSAEGFHAFEREWRYGNTVAVAPAEDVASSTEKRESSKQIYLFRTKSGWGVIAPHILTCVDYTQEHQLEDACSLAIGFLRCPDLPFSPDDILISTGRSSEGGDFSHLQHRPTGTIKELFRPSQEGRIVVRTKNQALDEIAFDLAREQARHNKSDSRTASRDRQLRPWGQGE